MIYINIFVSHLSLWYINLKQRGICWLTCIPAAPSSWAFRERVFQAARTFPRNLAPIATWALRRINLLAVVLATITAIKICIFVSVGTFVSGTCGMKYQLQVLYCLIQVQNTKAKSKLVFQNVLISSYTITTKV